MSKRLFPILLACAILIPSLLSADSVVEEIVARVNGQIITRTQYQREEQQVKDECQHSDPPRTEQECADVGKDVLRGLIDRQLLLDKGKELDITADTELVKRLDELRKKLNLDTMEDLEKAATAQGVSFEDFKQNMRTEIITQRVIQQEVGSKVNVSDQDVKQFYEEHKAQMAQPEQVEISEILLSTDTAGDDAGKLAAIKAKADDLAKQLRAGGSFEDAAKKESQDPSGAQGGALGAFKRGQLAKQLEDLTFGMKVGDISDAIRTKQGFVILKVTAHQQPGVPPLSEVQARIQEQIYMQKIDPNLRDYLKKLREEAFIDIRPGYVDTGASANETKPIVTTAAKETNAKELKKRKKLGVF